MPGASGAARRARAKRIFGTKMRSFIKQANRAGIKDVVTQQFDVARQILAVDLVPIIEPEIDIHCPDKAGAEALLKGAILEALEKLKRASRSWSRSRCRSETTSTPNWSRIPRS